MQHKLVVWKTERDGLQALSVGGFETRHESVLATLEQADLQHGSPPFGPMLVHTDDRPISAAANGWRAYAFCTAAGYTDLPVPDFVFGGWPQVAIDDFDETAWSISAAGDLPPARCVVGWIGSCHTHPVRWRLYELGRQNPDLLDVHHVEWVQDPSHRRLASAAGNQLSLPEQAARWSALLDVEGLGYSGRMKLLMHSGRPLLVQDRPWREWFWDALVPMEHYIPVRSDLSDLVDHARWVLENPHEAARIGSAAQKVAQQLLTRASAAEQWGRYLAIAATSDSSSWAPDAVREELSPLLRRLGAPV